MQLSIHFNHFRIGDKQFNRLKIWLKQHLPGIQAGAAVLGGTRWLPARELLEEPDLAPAERRWSSRMAGLTLVAPLTMRIFTVGQTCKAC